MGERTTVIGTILAVVFQNEENGYTVARIVTDDGEPVTVVGCIPCAAPGEELILTGRYTTHPQHGEQFAADEVERHMPTGETEILNYLVSGVVRGIGPATAQKLVDRFGADTLDVLDGEPEKLKTIKGITDKRAREIAESWRELAGLRRVLDFLTKYDLPVGLAMQLFRRYGADAMDALRRNPYLLSGIFAVLSSTLLFLAAFTLNMAQQGVFGDITHVKGAYNHCLSDIWPDYNADWRMQYNMKYRGDIYPTHGMGPACQLLNIHRGDRMKYLVSMDSDPLSLPVWLKVHGRDKDAEGFRNGEVTLTLIRTEKGKTIQIEHNVASPRPYSRMYQLTGTKGFAEKYPVEGYALDSKNLPTEVVGKETFTAHEFMTEEVKQRLMLYYKDEIVRNMEERAKEVGGHGGMDFIMDSRLIYCLHHGLPLDMDVYDLAEWCALIPLTQLSIENGFVPVEVPDFTRGAWNKVKGYWHAFAD